MRRSVLQLTIVGCIATVSAASGHRGQTQTPLRVSFADFVKIVDATTCANQKGWNQPCLPQPVTLEATRDGTPVVAACPGCLTALSTSGAMATGTLKAMGQDMPFRTDASEAGELAATVARLSAHFDNRFFVDAKRPRGLAIENDALLVADFGTGQDDGRVWRIPLGGHGGPLVAPAAGAAIAESLPSVAVATNFQGQPFKAVVGIAAALPFDDAILALTNRVVGKDVEIPGLANFPAAALLRVKRSGVVGTSGSRARDIVASLIDFETRLDPDRDGVECNPYDFVVRDALVYATDAAGNSIVRIDPNSGKMSLYAVLDEIPRAQPGPDGKSTTDAVPTGLDFGPDGALYVASLGGFPFASGSGRVIRLADLNRDGDALDRGEQTVAVTGLTMAIDVAFDRSGTMFTAEHSLAFATQGPGRVCRIDAGKCGQVVTDTAAGPTSLAVSGGYAYYSQEFLGRVSRVRVPDVDDHRRR